MSNRTVFALVLTAFTVVNILKFVAKYPKSQSVIVQLIYSNGRFTTRNVFNKTTHVCVRVIGRLDKI